MQVTHKFVSEPWKGKGEQVRGGFLQGRYQLQPCCSPGAVFFLL
jgi:hypothetical protein